VCSGLLDESKERWYVCLKGGKRGSLCGTKKTPELCKLEQGNQVRGASLRVYIIYDIFHRIMREYNAFA